MKELLNVLFWLLILGIITHLFGEYIISRETNSTIQLLSVLTWFGLAFYVGKKTINYIINKN
jgi:hypothetical protein